MSLLTESYEDFVILRHHETPDGEGSASTSYTDGDAIKASAMLDTSTQAKIAQASGAKALYTITTRRSTTLMYHDVLRRVSDGKIFRVTSDGTDAHTPKMACLDMRQTTAEEWKV